MSKNELNRIGGIKKLIHSVKANDLFLWLTEKFEVFKENLNSLSRKFIPMIIGKKYSFKF